MKVEVTQADRDAAADLYCECINPEGPLNKLIVTGDFDDHPAVQAFARHRLAVLRALREPTFEMKMAGAEAITADTMKAMANYDGAIQCWQAMIDAALNDKH